MVPLVLATAAVLAVTLLAALAAVLIFVMQISAFVAETSVGLEVVNEGASRLAQRLERMQRSTRGGEPARRRRDVATRTVDALVWIGLVACWLLVVLVLKFVFLVLRVLKHRVGSPRCLAMRPSAWRTTCPTTRRLPNSSSSPPSCQRLSAGFPRCG